MLKGFEDKTEDLSETERLTVLPPIIETLTRCIGRDSAMTNKQIVKELECKGVATTERRVRKSINYIRITGKITGLIATSAGYFVSKNRDEVNDYIDSLMGREDAIRQVRESFQHQLKTLNYG